MLSTSYELVHIYMNIILLYPFRGVGGNVLIAEITLFATRLFSFAIECPSPESA